MLTQRIEWSLFDLRLMTRHRSLSSQRRVRYDEKPTHSSFATIDSLELRRAFTQIHVTYKKLKSFNDELSRC